MSWAFYFSAAITLCGVIAVLCSPSVIDDPERKVGFLGLMALGLGMITFLVGLALTQAH